MITYRYMKIKLILLLLMLSAFIVKAQYPFEKYPAIKDKEYKDWKIYDRLGEENKIHFTLTIPKFFDNGDSITVQLTSFGDLWHQADTSQIRIYRNHQLIQKIKENMQFDLINMYYPLRTADFNGDGLTDLKIVVPYMGNGIAALNMRVIYLFQNADHHFTKISFTDMVSGNRPERDLDGDGNYEIITMTLQNYGEHNYWLFNLYNFNSKDLVSVNAKHDYPIMVQYLNRENYEITDKILRAKMKDFALPLPQDYDRK